jgi:hypothetical protein
MVAAQRGAFLAADWRELEMKRFAWCMLAAVSLAAASAGPAQADSTCAAAMLITTGTQHFGNTLCRDAPGDPCPDHEYWKFNLLAGDRVAIDWQITGNADYACCLSVFPADTTDFSINNVSALRYFAFGRPAAWRSTTRPLWSR